KGSGGGGGGGSGSGGDGSGGGRGGAVERGGSGGGQRQQQQRPSETLTPQQLRDRAGQTCGKFHSQHRYFSCLDDAWCAEFGDEAERPRWLELLRSGVDIFALDYEDIIAAMYALSVSAEGDCYLCVPPDPGIEAAALCASESSLPGTAPAEALHTFTLDSGASRCFFRDSGQDHERYFLLVVEDYTRYTTVFPLHSKGEVLDVLIPWIRAVRLQLRERFREDLPFLRQHSDRGGEFSSDPLRDFCHGEGILHSFTLPASPQQNGVADRRIGLVMEVARTSMIHVAAPHFLWSFVVRYAAHQLSLWPHVSLPETSPTLCWMGKVGDVSVFRV
ncbi:unnamed protein product, partial [Closterium sp. NIES-54]